MSIESVLESYKKGTFTTLSVSRPAKVRATCTDEISKISRYTNVRFGISYDNISQTIHKREEGELPSENQGLPWGQWENFPFTITHKGIRYLRFYATKDNIKTIWLKNGEVVQKSEILDELLSSEKSTKPLDNILTLTIKEENIIK
jgi:hypothetical protein